MIGVATTLGKLTVRRDGAGPPLLLLCGLGGHAAFWEGTIARLRDGWDCIAFDHPGCGASPPWPGAVSVRSLADAALALLDALGLDRADVIGHSLGGAMAQALALAAPERVGRLVLSSTWARPSAHFEAIFGLRRALLGAVPPLDYARLGTLLGYPPNWVSAQGEALETMLAARAAQLPPPELERARIDAVLAHDLYAELMGLAAPTLVVFANDDAIVPAAMSAALADIVPGAERLVFETGGHFTPVTRAEAYHARVRAFLTGDAP